MYVDEQIRTNPETGKTTSNYPGPEEAEAMFYRHVKRKGKPAIGVVITYEGDVLFAIDPAES